MAHRLTFSSGDGILIVRGQCRDLRHVLQTLVLRRLPVYFKLDVEPRAAETLVQGSVVTVMAHTSSAGGFLPNALPSPPPSSVADSSVAPNVLPHPRHQPLKLGSAKETAFINHMDQNIARMQGQFAKRTSPKDTTVEVDDETTAAAGNMPGYKNFKEAGRDIEKQLEIVWISGTPTLQISYLLSLALLLASFIPAFSPPSPRTMFRVLKKMDLAFAGLLQGLDAESGEALPGYESRRNIVTGTEKVRIKSLVEKTRILVTEKMAESGVVDEEDEREDEGDAFVDVENDYDMDVARVYDRTLVELGDELGGSTSATDID